MSERIHQISTQDRQTDIQTDKKSLGAKAQQEEQQRILE
jgi:hypothetical protein